MKYDQIIQRLWELNSGAHFSSVLPENVLSLYELFFAKAQSEVLLFHTELDPQIFNGRELTREMERATSRRVNIELISQKPNSPVKFFDRLVELTQQVPFADYTELPVGYLGPDSKFLEYCVVDKKAFRFSNPGVGSKGVAYMNSPEAETLSRVFKDTKRNLRAATPKQFCLAK